jgi:hypothetical protein
MGQMVEALKSATGVYEGCKEALGGDGGFVDEDGYVYIKEEWMI